MNCLLCPEYTRRYHSGMELEIRASHKMSIDFGIWGQVYHCESALCQVCNFLYYHDPHFHETARQMVVAKTLAAHPPNGTKGAGWV